MNFDISAYFYTFYMNLCNSELRPLWNNVLLNEMKKKTSICLSSGIFIYCIATGGILVIYIYFLYIFHFNTYVYIYIYFIITGLILDTLVVSSYNFQILYNMHLLTCLFIHIQTSTHLYIFIYILNTIREETRSNI